MIQINPPVGLGKKERKLGCLAVLGFMLLTVVITADVAYYWLLFPKCFKLVGLSQKAQIVLDNKLKLFEGISVGQSQATHGATSLSPEGIKPRSLVRLA